MNSPDEKLTEARATVPPPLWLLVMITLGGTIAMHMFVPGLPQAAAELGSSPHAMQLTISLYIVGQAIGQLFYGPLADRIGRRPTLMAGLGIYCAASVAAGLAPTIGALLVARFVQALGGSVGLVLGRAIVRDTAEGAEVAKRLSILVTCVTIGPALAPIIGGFVSEEFGWRALFALMVAFGIVNMVVAWRRLPETIAHKPKSTAELLRDYRGLVRTRAFILMAIGGGCASTSLYAFIAAAPFIFAEQLGKPLTEVGLYTSVLVIGISLGSLMGNRFAGRFSISRLLAVASFVSVIGALLFLAIVASGHLSIIGVLAPITIFSLGAGMASPMALTIAVGIRPNLVASASGLYGFVQMMVGAICTAFVGLGADAALAAAAVLAIAGVIGQICFGLARRDLRRAQAGA